MPKAPALAVGVLCFALLFIVRVEFLFSSEAAQSLPRYIGSVVMLEGVVSADPDVREAAVRVMVRVHGVDDVSGSGTLLAVLPKGTAVSYNDTVVLRGALETPRAFLTDTGRVFDYPGYLRVRGVSALMQKAVLVERIESNPTVFGLLYSAKHAFERSIERILPAQDAHLLEGILLGERRGLSEELTTAFIIASLIHVVVLSGYNISIVAEAVLRATGFLPRTAQYMLGIGLMLFFVLMTGAGSTSLRAGIMALIAVLARYLRRPAVALRALAAAGVVLVLLNPLVVLYDPSFILSFLATFGLITLAPAIEQRLRPFLGGFPQLQSIAASTIAVQMYILPALLYYTGVLSLVALPANLVALPFIPFAMLFGFVAGLLGFIHPLLGLLPALLSDLALRWLMFVAQTASVLPLSHITIPPFPWVVAALVYVPLTWLAVRIYLRLPTNLNS